MRRRTRSMATNDLHTGPGFSPRQVTAMAVAFLLAVLLVPVGAQAAQVVNAIITDPGGTNQATVDADGNLSISGEVTADPHDPVAIMRADDPGRTAFQRQVLLSTNVSGDIELVDVPANRRLVITYVSGTARLPSGQSVSFSLEVNAGGYAEHAFVPTFLHADGQGNDVFAFTQDTMIYASGQVSVRFFRSPPGPGQALAAVSLSGYLIDCSVAACN